MPEAFGFGGGEDIFVTWDGQPVSPVPPHGAAVVVAARNAEGFRVLLLHRAHYGPSYEGDWAWTPPTGGRLPGEPVEACAARELWEESGIEAAPIPVAVDGIEWALFVLEVDSDCAFTVDNVEHDRAEWVTADEALDRCRPEIVARGIAQALATLE